MCGTTNPLVGFDDGGFASASLPGQGNSFLIPDTATMEAEMQMIRDEMESYAKELLFTQFSIDVRQMDASGIAEVRKIWPQIAGLVAEQNREIVELLLDLAHTGDRILAEIVGNE